METDPQTGLKVKWYQPREDLFKKTTLGNFKCLVCQNEEMNRQQEIIDHVMTHYPKN